MSLEAAGWEEGSLLTRGTTMSHLCRQLQEVSQ